MTTSTYSVKVNAQMDVRLNHWLWLVKWLLAIPETSRTNSRPTLPV
jgi:hypothetical protein